MLITLAGNLFATLAGASPGKFSALQVDFCLVPKALDTANCRPGRVTLPHRFEVVAGGPANGWYRITLPRPAPGRHAITLSRLSLDGAVRIHGRLVLDTMDPQQLTRQRYWPQSALFEVERGDAKPLVIDVTVRGLPQTKNGLGGLEVTDAATGERAHHRNLIFDVMTVAALAAAALIAGIIGLAIGGGRDHSARILAATSWLAVLAALRCAHNLVTHPPTGMLTWQVLGVWLLALVGLQALHVVVVYLQPARRATPVFLLAAIGSGALLQSSVNLTLHSAIIDVLFAALLLLGLGLLVMLVRQVWQRRDAPGIVILLSFLAVLVTGLHDLSLHFGSASLSDRYLQTWSMPAVVMLAIVALARRSAERRSLELALQDATARREDLLRDLHDRVGSRLVALAFHAQQRDEDPLLLEEIKSLIHEVRMIQSAVGVEATTLEALLADLRHLYSRIGGGRLPLRWDIFDLPEPLHLSADQAIAVVRIVEEAVANALKHAAPSTIGVRLSPAVGETRALLEISDDGGGEFLEANVGGLHNMRLRAQQTGLGLELLQHERSKTIRILFPAAKKPPSGLRQRLRRWINKGD